MDKETKITIVSPFFSNFLLNINLLLNRVLIFLHLREKRKFWGIVYDSVSKMPLDPVKVNLMYADTGKLEGSCLTDLEGRYGFLARPGKFKIFVQKTNYLFPSELVRGNHDGIYTNLYHGEFFELSEDSEVIAPNIPMDPISPDWNQEAKRPLLKQSYYIKLFFEKLIGVLFWFGFIFSSLFLISSRVDSKLWISIFGVFFVLFLLELFIPESRLWGSVLHKKTKSPVYGLHLELLNKQTAGVVFASARVREDGKFFLRANPGIYILRIKDIDTGVVLTEKEITVNSNGVCNSIFLVSF